MVYTAPFTMPVGFLGAKKPSDPPIQSPNKYELAINLKAGNSIG
jgi:hypothetical protein